MVKVKKAAASEEPSPLSRADVRCASRLLDETNPFPTSAIAGATPLMWAVAEALARATSLHTACVYTHLMLVISLPLGAVQLKYGGILGRFCNMLVLQHGEPGEGKSVIAWLTRQILYYYDKKREESARGVYKEELKKYKEWKEGGSLGEPVCEPQKEAPKDSVFNKGTFIGLGNFLKHQDGAAFLCLDEGKTWLPQAFGEGPGGGVDDLNQIYDHDLYKNHPGNTQNQFYVLTPRSDIHPLS